MVPDFGAAFVSPGSRADTSDVSVAPSVGAALDQVLD